MNLLILAANGQIAQLVEQRISQEPKFKEVHLTLGLRNRRRLIDLQDRARILEVNLLSAPDVDSAVAGQDLVFVGMVDHSPDNVITHNVIEAMTKHDVQRVIFSNILGIYNEVGGEFGRWNYKQVLPGLQEAIHSDQLLADSGLKYTTLRLPWLNDRAEVKYTITTRDQPYYGVSGSRQSMADVVLQIIANPSLFVNESIGIADPDTEGEKRPVY
ncbi:NAD(P)H-binding protein [Lactobacillus xylocopicola]|uniref:Saccharopine dehydrogenase n=1 Tax=Lactobacillus xylocopicola TaxID=2976676 RepID=A0ABN6SLN3_9LACO|nr:NAD(P)H-binding protein [Lactobacillus xylocopicola]BDR59802.1 saccharopine dehydrogenase [Lactobacillus xylocopicola]